MEEMSIHHLSQFITEEIFLLPEEFPDDPQIESSSINPLDSPSSAPLIPIISQAPQAVMEKNINTESIKDESIPLLGNFEKGVLILIEEAVLMPEVIDMLVKMLNAVGHSMRDVGLIHSNTLEKRSLTELHDLNAHVILKFGRLQHPINSLPANQYEVYAEEGVQYLFADALSTIAEDSSLKKRLWGALQILFNISK